MVLYCHRQIKCYNIGYKIIPSNITNIEYNENWIVAKTERRSGSVNYWVANKVNTTSQKNVKLNEVDNNVYGPYAKTRFNTVIDSLGVDIYVE